MPTISGSSSPTRGCFIRPLLSDASILSDFLVFCPNRDMKPELSLRRRACFVQPRLERHSVEQRASMAGEDCSAPRVVPRVASSQIDCSCDDRGSLRNHESRGARVCTPSAGRKRSLWNDTHQKRAKCVDCYGSRWYDCWEKQWLSRLITRQWSS